MFFRNAGICQVHTALQTQKTNKDIFTTVKISYKLIILSDETKDKPRDPDPSATEGSCYGLQETSQWNQIKVLLRRGYIKTKRDRVRIRRFLVSCFSLVLEHFDNSM
jgi:hypothetical protein